jgi:hypothetical protein
VFLWRQRERELAGKRQVRFAALHAPADFRAPPRIELPDRFVAPGVEAVRIASDCRSSTKRVTFISEGTLSHNGQQGQNSRPRPAEIDLGRRTKSAQSGWVELPGYATDASPSVMWTQKNRRGFPAGLDAILKNILL